MLASTALSFTGGSPSSRRAAFTLLKTLLRLSSTSSADLLGLCRSCGVEGDGELEPFGTAGETDTSGTEPGNGQLGNRLDSCGFRDWGTDVGVAGIRGAEGASGDASEGLAGSCDCSWASLALDAPLVAADAASVS